MSENRRIEVSEEDSRFLEYDRIVKVQLYNSPNMSTSLKLNEQEARSLHEKLGEHLIEHFGEEEMP